MARRTAFSELVIRLRNATGRSASPAVGVDDLDGLKERINRVYTTLALKHDWPHLRKVFDRITLNAGQQYYDFPTGLDPERIEVAKVWYSGLPSELVRGITFEDYGIYDPSNDERSGPALKWDVRYTNPNEQIEIWPLPNDSDQEAQFIGIQAVSRMVNDADPCLLDDDLVILYATAEMLPTKKDDAGRLIADVARDHFNMIIARTRAAAPSMALGLGSLEQDKRRQVTVRVS